MHIWRAYVYRYLPACLPAACLPVGGRGGGLAGQDFVVVAGGGEGMPACLHTYMHMVCFLSDLVLELVIAGK